MKKEEKKVEEDKRLTSFSFAKLNWKDFPNLTDEEFEE